MEEQDLVTPYWPVPPEWPLYVSPERAAEIAGVSREVIDQWLHDVLHPLPHIKVGRIFKVRTAALPEYMQQRELS